MTTGDSVFLKRGITGFALGRSISPGSLGIILGDFGTTCCVNFEQYGVIEDVPKKVLERVVVPVSFELDEEKRTKVPKVFYQK